MCDRRRDLSITSEIGIHFGAVESILTAILGMSKVLARWVLQMLADDQKRLGLIFLGIFCLTLKMIPGILSKDL